MTKSTIYEYKLSFVNVQYPKKYGYKSFLVDHNCGSVYVISAISPRNNPTTVCDAGKPYCRGNITTPIGPSINRLYVNDKNVKAPITVISCDRPRELIHSTA